MNSETDPELISQTLAGDRLAAERLVERHRSRVTRVAFRALDNADDAQDVAQEALVYALQRLSEVREPCRFSAWLRHVTLSLCVDYRRRRGTRRLGEPITVLNEASEEADYGERLAIRQAVSHLSEAQRITLLLHYVGGWSREEVARLLAIPMNTVRSRLMTAKRRLRADLHALQPKGTRMPVNTLTLTEAQTSLIEATFPMARIVTVETDPEPWMPFSPRVRLALADGTEKSVDFRGDIDADRAALLAVLQSLGIPGPRLIGGPTANNSTGSLCLTEVPRGENLLLWTLGGTPHRIRLATERAFEAIDQLQGATERLLASPVGPKLPRRARADEAAAIREAGGAWLAEPWFAAALTKVADAVAGISDPLVFTDYLHFFPNFLRVQPGTDPCDTPLGWPGDARLQANPLTEFVSPFGHLGDPLLGLAMVWVYDCYPFVHTGFVEQFLWRRNITRRDFAPRLALSALRIIRRELPVTRPAEGTDYWDSLHGYVDQALGWM